MDMYLKCKFKERIVIVAIGLTFTVLLVLETTFLNAITPLSKQTRDQSLHGEKGTGSERAAIFEGIIQNLDSHLGVMRRELSVTEESQGERLTSKVKHLHESDVNNPDIKEAISHSRVVQKYAGTFLKIADILNKSQGKKSEAWDGKASAAQGKASGGHGGLWEKKPMSSAWPRLEVYSGNVSISNRVHPNGYMKREGKDLVLGYNVTHTLRYYARILGKKHQRKNSSDWDTLEVYEDSGKLQAYKRWHNAINRYQLYPDDPVIVDNVLRDLRTLTPDEVYEKPDAGTQFKLYFHFENHARALFKAMRYNRDQETLPDQYYFSDFERFNAEIAAFHLDRLLGFNRVPPATGRVFHIKNDIEKYAVEGLEDEIFYSPAGNLCIRGRCDYYCDLHHMVCGRPDLIEGVLMAYLPSQNIIERKSWKHPWRRSYIVLEAAKWENDPRYCDKVRHTHPYNKGRRLLDLMDLSIFDFLIGNMDRHHYETIKDFGNDTFMLAYDNGKGFGSAREDEMTCLYPVIHCCLIRYTTYKKLLAYSEGSVLLSNALRHSLQEDPVSPVLSEPHLLALDRRVKVILKEIYQCTEKLGYEKVIVDDGF